MDVGHLFQGTLVPENTFSDFKANMKLQKDDRCFRYPFHWFSFERPKHDDEHSFQIPTKQNYITN